LQKWCSALFLIGVFCGLDESEFSKVSLWRDVFDFSAVFDRKWSLKSGRYHANTLNHPSALTRLGRAGRKISETIP
jgi:hypothetical protein